MRKRHLYKKFHITLLPQKKNDGKWWCRARVGGTHWKPHDEIGDTKNVAMKKALDKAKEQLDLVIRTCKCMGGELIPSVSRRV